MRISYLALPRFFMGPFDQLLSSEGGDLEGFKAAVGSFFSKFVHTMKPAAACIHDIFRAIQGCNSIDI